MVAVQLQSFFHLSDTKYQAKVESADHQTGYFFRRCNACLNEKIKINLLKVLQQNFKVGTWGITSVTEPSLNRLHCTVGW